MINIKNLNFHYQKKNPLYEDFSLELNAGQIIGLLGSNGAGKSTLLKIIAGVRKSVSGKLDINGFDPGDRDPNFIADLFMVPEDFSLPSITIACYVSATATLYPSFDKQKLEKLMEEFQLNKTHKLNQLSHGQRKKFLIAFALATNCKVLLLDEPTNGLDIPSKSIFRKILVGSVTEEQLVLISTHQVKDIDTILDKVVVIDEGKIVYQENIENISQKLHFETVSSLKGLENLLYSEKCPMGYRVIVTTTDEDEESVIDMEMLFNAIVNKKI